MYISISEVLNTRTKDAVAEAHGVEVGLNWPETVVGPLLAKIAEINEDENVDLSDDEVRQDIIEKLKGAVLEHFPFIKPQSDPPAPEEQADQPKPKAKAKAKTKEG